MKLFILILLCSSFFTIKAQDTIIQKNGKLIVCNIQKEDSATVYFQCKLKGNKIETYLNKKDVKEIIHESTITRHKNELINTIDKVSLGLGVGPYFEIGGNLTAYPQRNIGLFLGLGYARYAESGIGINGGVKLRYVTKSTFSRLNPFFVAMYGQNSNVTILDASYLNKTFYGLTIGIGFDYKSYMGKKSYWTYALYLPFRNKAKAYLNELEKNRTIKSGADFFPISISIGYIFILK